MDAKDSEYDSWRRMCKELQRLMGLEDGELNEEKYKPLFKAIREWGENNAKLQTMQP